MWGGTRRNGWVVVRIGPRAAQALGAGALAWRGMHHLGHETCMELVHEF